MSETFAFDIDYDAPHSEANVRLVLDALCEAVGDNWQSFRDEYSDKRPQFPVEVDAWLDEIMCPRAQKGRGTKRDLYQAISASGYFPFDFSPLSTRTADFFVSCGEPTNGLGIYVSFSDRVLYEVVGSREMSRMESDWQQIPTARGEKRTLHGPAESDPEYWPWHEKWVQLEDTPSVWPQNKACLLHIFEKLRSVLPVKRFYLDEPLRDGNEDTAAPAELES